MKLFGRRVKAVYLLYIIYIYFSIIYVLCIRYLQGVPKKMSFSGKTAITTFKLIQNSKLGVFWKIQDVCYLIEIFKIEGEMTEKMKPKVATPPSS